jgi:hypothetical protein
LDHQRDGIDVIQQMIMAGGTYQTFYAALQSIALTSNLQLCLDAGDSASYTSGQKWLDRAGGGYDFFLGSDVTSQASDPTFTGSVGNRGAYWSFDGGDFFTYDSANETWMTNIHKDNAAFSLVAIYYQDGATDDIALAATGNASETGFLFYIPTTRKLDFSVQNAGTPVLGFLADTALSAGSWHMVGVSVNEATGAGGGFFYADGSYSKVSSADTFNSTYSSPSAGAATSKMCIGRFTEAGASQTADGQRMSCLAAWSTALTKANMDSIWSAMRDRFGI